MNNTILPGKLSLNDMSWKGIQEVCREGKAKDYWQAGSTKTITINGTVGPAHFRNRQVNAFILGIDHNAAVEGANRIHFGIGMKGNTLVGLQDKFFNQKIQDFSLERFCMYKDYESGSSIPGVAGWLGSYMRTSILGSNGSANDPSEGTLLAALPRALREVMAVTTKYTDNAMDSHKEAKDVTASRDLLWLPSEFEVYGCCRTGNGHEQEYQEWYDYFKQNRIPAKSEKRFCFWCRTKSCIDDIFCAVQLPFSIMPMPHLPLTAWSVQPIQWDVHPVRRAYDSLGILACFAVG